MRGLRGEVVKGEVLDALEGSRGSLALVAARLGRDINFVKAVIRSDPELALAYEAEFGLVQDLAEDRLTEAIDRGDPWAIKFFLSTKGGYTTKQEFIGSGPVVVLNWNEVTTNMALESDQPDPQPLILEPDEPDSLPAPD